MTNKQFEQKYLKYLHTVAEKLYMQEFYPIELKLDKNIGNSYATFDMSYPYKSITINYSEDLKNESESKIKDIMVHEMCHALTDPLYVTGHDRYVTKDQLNNVREELTDRLANIIRKNNIV